MSEATVYSCYATAALNVAPSPLEAMTQSRINIRAAAARVWMRQAGLAARITLNTTDPVTREEKLATFRQLTKLPNIKIGSELNSAKVRILIDHPHSYRDWQIVGPSSVPGFFHLRSSFPLSAPGESQSHSTFHLCLHETEFERIQ